MKPSSQQGAILRGASEPGHLLVEADAGTGKSTTIFMMIQEIAKKSLLLSFNQFIKADNDKRLKKDKITHVTCKTFHGFGLSVFPKKYKINPYKVQAYLDTLNLKREEKNSLCWLLQELRGRGFIGKTIRDLKRELKRPNLLRSPAENWLKSAKLVWECLQELDKITDTVDFDDMCRLPVLYGWIKKADLDFEVVYVDELQDLALYQVRMIEDLLEANPKIKIIGVGDRKQSIYGFRGARNSFESVFEILDHPPILPLTTTYRCHARLVDFVNTKVEASNMTAFHPGGEVVRIFSEPNDIWAVDEWLSHKPSMVISTRNSVLISIWISLLERDISGYFKGTSLIDTMKSITSGFQSMDMVKFTKYLKDLSSSNYRNSKMMNEHTDVAQALLELIGRLKISTKFELREVLDLMRKSTKGDIALETVHSAKGREADCTVFLWSFWTKDQKEETKYVALTRAKSKLIVVVPPVNT